MPFVPFVHCGLAFLTRHTLAVTQKYLARNPDEEIWKAFKLFDEEGNGRISVRVRAPQRTGHFTGWVAPSRVLCFRTCVEWPASLVNTSMTTSSGWVASICYRV